MSLDTAPEALEAMQAVEARLDALWALPAPLSVIEWGHHHLELTTGNRKGPWTPDAYQVEILEAAMDPDVRRISFMKPAQVGWTLLCQVLEGYGVHHLGLPVLHILASAEMASKFGKERLEPMIDSCPALKEILVRPTAKNTGSTTRHKIFRNGGSIFLGSAGNPRELRGFQAALMVFDERDAWKVDLNGEGNPARIAEARGKTYPSLKILEGSTPGALPKGLSPIEQGFERGSRGRWNVPCPHCGMAQRLIWQDPDTKLYRLVFERQGAGGREVVPGSVAYLCAGCDRRIEESWKWQMTQAGLYVHEYGERRSHRSFHMTALASVAGEGWELLAQQWLDAQGDPTELKTFVTLNLGEAWEDRGDSVTPSILRKRADLEDRPRDLIPDGVATLTAFVDVQGEGSGRDGYLFGVVLGWGADEECWLIDWTIEPGDVADPALWGSLDTWLLKDRVHEVSGRRMRPAVTLVDSASGSHADAVYSYVLPRQGSGRRVFAARGVVALDRPGLAKESTTKRARVRLWNLSTMAWKQKLFGMLQRPNPGPGYVHLAKEWVTDEFTEQLTSESYVSIQDPKTRKVRGEWRQTRARNEAWDCFGGCLCGLWILRNVLAPRTYRDLAGLAQAMRALPEAPKPEEAPAQRPLNLAPSAHPRPATKGVW